MPLMAAGMTRVMRLTLERDASFHDPVLLKYSSKLLTMRETANISPISRLCEPFSGEVGMFGRTGIGVLEPGTPISWDLPIAMSDAR